MEARATNPVNATPETSRAVISNYTCMAATILVLVARFGLVNIKWRRRIGWDDILLYLALLAAIVESILCEHAVRRGLGTYIRPGNAAMLKRLGQVRSEQNCLRQWLTAADRVRFRPVLPHLHLLREVVTCATRLSICQSTSYRQGQAYVTPNPHCCVGYLLNSSNCFPMRHTTTLALPPTAMHRLGFAMVPNTRHKHPA